MTDKRTYHSKLREQSKLNTIDSILNAAVKLHGKGDTSLDSLAEEAGVSIPTIRKYFPTKEDLFLGCTNHFVKNVNIPNLEAMSQIEDVADRLAYMVSEIFRFLDIAIGQNWLAYKLQDESSVMFRITTQLEELTQAATHILLGDDLKNEQNSYQDQELFGYICGLISPLTYRSLRIIGGLTLEQCIRQTMITIASRMDITLSDKHFHSLKI